MNNSTILNRQYEQNLRRVFQISQVKIKVTHTKSYFVAIHFNKVSVILQIHLWAFLFTTRFKQFD